MSERKAMNDRPGRILLVAIVLSTAAVAVACASPPRSQSLILHVSNELGRPISEIQEKPCGDLALAYSPIEDSRFGVGETRGLRLPPTCVDLVAYDARGQIVGEQRGLEMLPDASWVIRK